MTKKLSEKQFTMSMFASQKDLYKAKCEYLESQLSERDKRITELEEYILKIEQAHKEAGNSEEHW